MKDNFSHDSGNYAQFRPSYPKEVFTFLETLLNGRECAWDCATGNGQVAKELADIFDHIEATDLSENQLKNAVLNPKIHYSKQLAEETNFPNHHFDCITVGQAIHWFDFEKFYPEAKRVLKLNGLLIVLGYGNIIIKNPEIQNQVSRLYSEILGTFWDSERHYVDENYQTIPFPFEEIRTPKFEQHYMWSAKQLIGYLETWSAVKHFKDQNQNDPLANLKRNIHGVESISVRFPILFRVGKMVK